MAGTATIEAQPFAHALYTTWLPDTFVVPEMELDHEVRLRAGNFIGKVIAGENFHVEAAPVEKPIESLYEGMQRAHYEKDPEARSLVEINVRTDSIERTIKTGHVTEKVPLIVTEDSKIMQFGQVMDSIQANSLRFAAAHPVMKARTEAETRNSFRTERLYKDGFFEDYSMFTMSRAEKLPEAGFFTETMSCSLQLISKAEQGLTLESAFVSGIAKAGQDPHDEATAIRLGERLGADYEGLSAAEIIDMPILIHNSLIPNGVIDLVEMWDEASGLGTFFGEDRPTQDYLKYLDYCHEREVSFQPKVAQITDELIAAAPNIHSPLEAARLLNDLTGLRMVEQAIVDKTIDSRVFGYEAAGHIEAARIAYLRGDFAKVENLQHKAERSETSSSCPSALKGKDADNLLGEDDQSDSQASNDDADCEFISKTCPECSAKNVKTRVEKLKSSGKKRISGSCGCVKIAS